MQKILIANWKSNKTIATTEEWFQELLTTVGSVQTIPATIAIAPPYPLLPAVAEQIEQSGLPLNLAVQDISQFPAGSYTGAVSAVTLQSWPIKYVIVGHSERRRYFHETAQEVALKVEQALNNNLTPVVCVDRPYIAEQASAIEKELLARCVVAYEPLSAIGSGHNEDVSKVKEALAEVKTHFGDVPVIYGGSVDESNLGEYLLVSDGVLVGGASLSGVSFGMMLQKVQQTYVANQATIGD